MASSPQGAPGAGAPGGGSSTTPSAPNPAQAAGSPSGSGGGNPVLKAALGQLTGMAQTARTYAQAYPQCAEEMRQIGALLQKCLMKTTQAQPQGEQPVPPV